MLQITGLGGSAASEVFHVVKAAGGAAWGPLASVADGIYRTVTDVLPAGLAEKAVSPITTLFGGPPQIADSAPVLPGGPETSFFSPAAYMANIGESFGPGLAIGAGLFALSAAAFYAYPRVARYVAEKSQLPADAANSPQCRKIFELYQSFGYSGWNASRKTVKHYQEQLAFCTDYVSEDAEFRGNTLEKKTLSLLRLAKIDFEKFLFSALETSHSVAKNIDGLVEFYAKITALKNCRLLTESERQTVQVMAQEWSGLIASLSRGYLETDGTEPDDPTLNRQMIALREMATDLVVGMRPVPAKAGGTPRIATGGSEAAFFGEAEKDVSFEDAMRKLNGLVGLDIIKTQIQEYADYQQFAALRREKGVDDDEPPKLHAIFAGAPGTGKTTVAKLLGVIYKHLGLLSKGHVHAVKKADLVGEYHGHSSPKVKAAIEKARGGILFIDEAYGLFRGGSEKNPFESDVLEMLLMEMSDGPGDIAIIFAGYPDEMLDLVGSNPGFLSRVLSYMFPSYTLPQLLEIADKACEQRKVTLSPEAKQALDEGMAKVHAKRDRRFGNARFAHDIIKQARIHLASRVMKLSPETRDALSVEEMSHLNAEDITAAFKRMKSIRGTQNGVTGFGASSAAQED